MNWEARAIALEQRVAELEFELDGLRAALNARGSPYFAGLTASEASIGQLLRERAPGVVSNAALYDLLYSLRGDSEMPEPKIIDVWICKLRAKVSAFSIEIRTAWGRGYFMPEESAAAWDAASGLVAS